MSKIRTFFHGTSDKASRLILEGGFDLSFAGTTTDPGDFGCGVYVCDKPSRCAEYGGGFILEVKVDTSHFLHVAYPYFMDHMVEVPPVTDDEKFFYALMLDQDGKVKTVVGQERAAHATYIREACLAAGFKGMTTEHNGNEAVIYALSTIMSVTIYGDGRN